MGDWLLTVPLLLIEILLVMKLTDEQFSSKTWALGVGSALMIVSGYYGELVVTGDLSPRWNCWYASMVFFLYIVYELLIGLSTATNLETNRCGQGQDQDCPNHDCDQLVHLPCGLPFPHAWHQCSFFCGLHSDWLLCI